MQGLGYRIWGTGSGVQAMVRNPYTEETTLPHHSLTTGSESSSIEADLGHEITSLSVAPGALGPPYSMLLQQGLRQVGRGVGGRALLGGHWHQAYPWETSVTMWDSCLLQTQPGF